MHTLLQEALGIIFDVDGLMIDSEPLWQATRDEFFKLNSLTRHPEEDHLFVGRGIKEIISLWKEMYGLSGDVDERSSEYRQLFYILALQSRKLSLMEGTADLIMSLFNSGKRLAIATGGHTQEKMKEILRTFDLDKYFVVVVSSDQVKKGKPAPDIFLFASQQIGIPKENCIILEDAVNGVQAAKSAKMTVIGIQKDPIIAQKLREEHADLVTSSLVELL